MLVICGNSDITSFLFLKTWEESGTGWFRTVFLIWNCLGRMCWEISYLVVFAPSQVRDRGLQIEGFWETIFSFFLSWGSGSEMMSVVRAIQAVTSWGSAGDDAMLQAPILNPKTCDNLIRNWRIFPLFPCHQTVQNAAVCAVLGTDATWPALALRRFLNAVPVAACHL